MCVHACACVVSVCDKFSLCWNLKTVICKIFLNPVGIKPANEAKIEISKLTMFTCVCSACVCAHVCMCMCVCVCVCVHVALYLSVSMYVHGACLYYAYSHVQFI